MNRQMLRPVRRGEIYFADLSPVTGAEQGGVRPVLIVQNNIGNRYSPTIIAAAITGCRKRSEQPTHVQLLAAECGLRYDSTVLLEQLRTLDRERLRSYIGRISQQTMGEVDTALGISIGLVT